LAVHRSKIQKTERVTCQIRGKTLQTPNANVLLVILPHCETYYNYEGRLS
jgi:hypothetical protein